MIGIIDYNAGNITSVERALKNLNIDFLMSKNPNELENCDKLIFPGVGDASYAMQQLAKLGFDKFILSQVKKTFRFWAFVLVLKSFLIFLKKETQNVWD